MQGTSADLFAILLARKNSGGGGGGGGTGDYNDLSHQPQINGTTLVGNKSSADLELAGLYANSTSYWNNHDATSKTNAIYVYTDFSNNQPNIKIGDGTTTISNLPFLTVNAAVKSVAGKTGVVTLDANDVGLGNVDNVKQVAGLDSGTTSGNLVKWGINGYTVADTGVSTETTLTSDSNAKLPTSKAVATYVGTEIGKLDVTGDSNIAASKTIASWSETDGKVSITTQNISISAAQAGLGNVTNNAQVKKISSSTSGDIVTWDATTGDTVADSGKSFETTLTTSSDTKIPTSKAVASHVTTEIGKLDVAGASNIAASKTISAWSEADGKVSITTQDISITKSQVSDFPTLGTAAAADTTDFATAAQGSTADTAIQSFKINSGSELKSGTSVNVTSVPASILTGTIPSDVTATTQSTSDDSTKVATTAFVHDVVDALPEPMVFKGTLGTGGTITTLPVDGTATVGDTYKVITDGTYASQSAKIGDTFICQTKTSNANTWVLIPSGDEPSGTVTSVGVARDSSNHAKGIKTDQTNDGPITTSGTLSLALQSDTYSSLTATTRGSTADREYAVGLDASGNLSVNVPWTDTNLPTFDGTYNASTNKAATVSTVTNAINALDVTGDSSIAASKTISAWSEADGKVSISVQDISISASQAGLGNVTNDAQVKKISSSTSGNIVTWDAATGDTVADSGKSFETSLTANSDTKIPTSKAVADYISNQYPRLYVDNQGYIAIDYGS